MYSTISSSLFLFFLTFLFHSFPCVSSNPEWCDTRFQCGNITAGFPFWGENRPKHCNHLDLHCKNNITYLFVPYHRFTVLQINQTSNTLTLARENNLGSFCASKPVNKTLPTEQLELLSTYKRLTVYACLCHPPNFLYCTCPHIGSFFHNPNDHYFCNKSFEINVPQSFVPGEKELNLTHLESVLRKGFEVKVKIDEKDCEECSSSHELCDIKTLPLGAKCDPIHSPTHEGLSTGVKACIAIAGVVVGVFILLAAALLYIARKRKKTQDARYTRKDLPITSYSSRETSRNPTSSTISSSINHSLLPSISNLANGNTYFGVQVFTYEELEEATANFSRELGDGGFGTVYYGVLKDGRSVAVKRLYERSLKRVEQFKNEIDILRSLKHPNLVILYGCTSRHSRELLLVYEYISNGTLADHLHGDRAESRPLCWSLRLKVAIETASALSFLHASGIIHRDVKTTNILLDENHQVKVADFGLSRLFPIDQTHISTAPQGTPGYVDPEYYQCYRLNEKSDVYSFGVVLTELISSKEAVDITRHRHDINLANMAVTKIQNNALHELVDPSLGFGKDPEIKRTMMAMAELAFRCLQQEREVRPSMDEIVEILKGIKMDNRVSSSPDVVDIERGGGDDIGLLRHSVPPPISPETDKWTSSSETAAST